jgi:putative OPT family oligopeptide transporter
MVAIEPSVEHTLQHEPYIPPEVRMPEMTARALISGTILGIIFGASSLYLVLKVGLTVSASIPVAVISLTLFKLWSKAGGKDATILENNIVQTAGSAGESIAFGLGVTMPSILILGFDLEITRVLVVGLLGGLIGILMMIPLRRALIVAQHGILKYPEGTACAEVLKAGASTESKAAAQTGRPIKASAKALAQGISAATIFTGFGVGLAYKTAMAAFKLWKDVPEKVFGAPLKGGAISAEISPELLGVGYIIGPRIGGIMIAGGILNALVLIPMIVFFGDQVPGIIAPGAKPIGQMSPGEIRGSYVLYIGAGAVAAGGIISLFRSLPTILHGLRAGVSDLRRTRSSGPAGLRTGQDLSMKFVVGGIAALVVAIMVTPSLHMNITGALLIIVFGFLFVTVSSRLTGEIGSSSNPISGMTVATLLLTCLVFLLAGWTGGTYYVTALSVGGIVCVAASNGGTTSQDLKTGFLVGATPSKQQIAILIGTAASALLLGPILLALNSTATVYVPASQIAPGLKAPDVASLTKFEALAGPQAASDKARYRVWHKTSPEGGPPGKYLVDGSGSAVWLVDPGINGAYKTRPDGTEVRKFDAPKATLMSYIIKGMLDRQLPWGLVLFGIMLSVGVELCGISSLTFAVGVYLPISSSAPIFLGGLLRWLADRGLRKDLAEHRLDKAELEAASDRSPGVLLSSGYIAGGAIAGILIAFVAGAMSRMDSSLTNWAAAHNPFYGGRHADALALIPFALLALFLYLVSRNLLLTPRPEKRAKRP